MCRRGTSPCISECNPSVNRTCRKIWVKYAVDSKSDWTVKHLNNLTLVPFCLNKLTDVSLHSLRNTLHPSQHLIKHIFHFVVSERNRKNPKGWLWPSELSWTLTHTVTAISNSAASHLIPKELFTRPSHWNCTSAPFPSRLRQCAHNTNHVVVCNL